MPLKRRTCWLVLALFFVLAPPVLLGAARAWERQANRVEDWLPEALPETRDLRWFVQRFGNDEYLAISWEGCTTEDPRLEEMRRRLVAAPEVDDDKAADGADEPVPLFRRVFTGATVLADLMAEPVSLDRAAAVKRFRGWLFADNENATCVIGLTSAAGEADRDAAVEQALRAADATPGLSRDTIRIAGPTYDTVAVDRASKDSLLRLNLFSWAVSYALLVALLRSARLALQVFVVAFGSEQVCLAVMYYSGGRLDSILLLAANLTFVVGVAGGVHLVNYAREAAASGLDAARAIGAGRLRTARPTLLATATTCLGMLSLCVSDLAPVRSFGLFSAAGVALGVVPTLLTLPAMMTLFPPRGWRRESIGPGAAAEAATTSPRRGGWANLAELVNARRKPILGVAALLLLLGLYAASGVRTTASPRQLFPEDARVLVDQRWFEQEFGGLVPIEVAIRFPAPPPETDDFTRSSELVRQLIQTQRVQVALRSMEGIRGAISAASFAPSLSGVAGRGSARRARRAVYAKQLDANRDALEDSGYFREYDGEWVWRVGLRTSTDQESRYPELLANVRRGAARVASAGQPEGAAAPQVLVTGGVPLVHRAQGLLLSDLTSSFATAVLMVGGAMVFAVRSFALGSLALVPSVLPVAAVFGVLGLVGVEVEVGAVLTASVSLGIAVDDSLHFLACYRAKLRDGADPVEAIRGAYRECGVAMVQTTIVLTLGLLVFAASDFVPIARFAWMTFSLLSVALLAALTVLPAIALTVDRHARTR